MTAHPSIIDQTRSAYSAASKADMNKVSSLLLPSLTALFVMCLLIKSLQATIDTKYDVYTTIVMQASRYNSHQITNLSCNVFHRYEPGLGVAWRLGAEPEPFACACAIDIARRYS